MAQVKKLSVATVFGKIKLTDLIAKRQMPVMKVVGTAVGTKKGMTGYGEYVALTGNFAATNPDTGEVNRAAVLFLPDVALLPIQTALSAPDARGVDFAIMVSVKYVGDDADHKAGGSVYEYTFDHLLDMGSDDPIARIEAKLLAQAEAKAKLLPPPDATPTPAPAPAPAKSGKGSK